MILELIYKKQIDLSKFKSCKQPSIIIFINKKTELKEFFVWNKYMREKPDCSIEKYLLRYNHIIYRESAERLLKIYYATKNN